MDKVYIVTKGSYSDYCIVAAFTEDHKSVAQKLADSVRDGQVEIYDLNPQVVFPELLRWEVTMWLESGDESIIRVCDEYYDENINSNDLSKLLPTKWEIYPYKPTAKIRVKCWAKDKKHALKIANEYRTRLVALGMKDLAENWVFGKNYISEEDVADVVKNILSSINEEVE